MSFLLLLLNSEYQSSLFSAIHIEDAIAASISTVSQDLNGIFHLAGPNPHSRLEMLEVLVDQLQVGANIKECLLSDLNFLDSILRIEERKSVRRYCKLSFIGFDTFNGLCCLRDPVASKSDIDTRG